MTALKINNLEEKREKLNKIFFLSWQKSNNKKLYCWSDVIREVVKSGFRWKDFFTIQFSVDIISNFYCFFASTILGRTIIIVTIYKYHDQGLNVRSETDV